MDIFVYNYWMYTNTKYLYMAHNGDNTRNMRSYHHAAVIMEIDTSDTFNSPGPILSPEYDM